MMREKCKVLNLEAETKSCELSRTEQQRLGDTCRDLGRMWGEVLWGMLKTQSTELERTRRCEIP